MSYKTPKLLKRKKLKLYFRISLWIIFTATLIGGISFWSYRPFFQIDEILIPETRFITKDFIKKIYLEESRNPFLFIFSKNTSFSIPENKINKRILENPAVEYFGIKKNSLNSIWFEIKEFEPFGVFCKKEECYFTNQEGKFFTKTDINYPDQVILLEANLDGEILGQNFSEPEIFRKFGEMTDLLKQIKIEINKIYTEDFETFNLVTTQGPELLIEKTDDPENAVNNLKTTLEQENIHDRQFGNLEYLDLRFDDKVYYKIK